jgi:hypothetical protein
LQTVLVGISGLDGPLVRPSWQPAPPKRPDIDVDWIGFGVSVATPDANSYVAIDDAGNGVSQRHQTLELSCAIYGPNCIDVYGLLEDGFQVPQNLYALKSASMGFKEIGAARRLPELINERWYDRVQTSIFIRREIQRTYAIPTIVSVTGVIHTVIGNEEYLLDWDTENVETWKMGYLQGWLGQFNPAVPTTIASSAQASAAVNTLGMALCGIILPATFTGTTITFQACDTIDGTFVDVKSTTSGSALSYTVAQGTYVAIDPKDFQGIQFLKIKSGSTEGGSRALLLALKGF